MNGRKRPPDRGRCEHSTFPVQVLPIVGGKKIAHCLGCGRSGPAGEDSAQALTALRGMPRPAFLGPNLLARELAEDGKR